MGRRRIFLKEFAAGGVLVAWRPSWAGASGIPMCRIVRPGDSDYDSVRTDFNLRFDVRPRAILFACNAADVVEGIRWARDEGIDLPPRERGITYVGDPPSTI